MQSGDDVRLIKQQLTIPEPLDIAFRRICVSLAEGPMAIVLAEKIEFN